MKLTPIELVLIDDTDGAFYDRSRIAVHVDAWWKIVHAVVTPMDTELENKFRWMLDDKIKVTAYETIRQLNI
jgi:hypothetical protein